jgi:hypothetical protein
VGHATYGVGVADGDGRVVGDADVGVGVGVGVGVDVGGGVDAAGESVMNVDAGAADRPLVEQAARAARAARPQHARRP